MRLKITIQKLITAEQVVFFPFFFFSFGRTCMKRGTEPVSKLTIRRRRRRNSEW
jgi:hypothetical protein